VRRSGDPEVRRDQHDRHGDAEGVAVDLDPAWPRPAGGRGDRHRGPGRRRHRWTGCPAGTGGGHRLGYGRRLGGHDHRLGSHGHRIAQDAGELGHHPHARRIIERVGSGQGGGHRGDRGVQAEGVHLLPEQARDVRPGRAADQDGLAGQAGQAIAAEIVQHGRIPQDVRPMIGHGGLQRAAGNPRRVDYVPHTFSHEGTSPVGINGKH
jgi:hypothetical protein